jgi:radical SAM protein with 4Fe4S-binding SPASM domain
MFNKYLNFSKSYNFILLFVSYFISKWLGKNYHWGKPIAVAIEPTTSCNLRCPECPSGLRSFSRNTGMLDLKLFEKVIDEMQNHLLYLNLYFQGEPYLNPNFFDFITYANNKKIITSTSTNAHYLNDDNARKTVESGLKRLIISIDGVTQKSYSSYRVGGKLEKVLEGTKNIIEWKKKLKSKYPQVVFQFLVVKQNEHEIEEIKNIGLKLGVDKVIYKTAQVYDFEDGNELIPSIEKYSRYKKLGNGKFGIKNPLKNQCWRMWHSFVMTWDGKVVPCCFDKDAHYTVGDLSKQSFEDVWKNKEYQKFRSAILKGRKEIDICKNCSEGTKVVIEA